MQGSRLAGAGLSVLLLVLLAPLRSRADPVPPPAQRAQLYSPYEQATIRDVLHELHAEREPNPENKIIEHIEIVPLDAVDDRDPGVKALESFKLPIISEAPHLLDHLHVTTKSYVVRREVLLREGEPYLQVVLDDTIRNLRALVQLSLVIVVPVKSAAEGRVGVVVITKDVWSLRPNWDFEVSSGGLDEFAMEPSEINVGGTHQTAFGFFDLLPLSLTLGAGYRIPRLAGTRIAILGAANVVLNRATGSAEGTYGSLVAGQPLYSAQTEWSWDASVAWQDFIQRRYENARLGFYQAPSTGQLLPFEYRSDAIAVLDEVTRSYGRGTKHDLTFAVGASRAVYSTDFVGFDPSSVADFVRANVPVSDTRVGPSVQYHTYAREFLRVFDAETLALQEDYRIGHDVYVRLYPSFKTLGSSRNVVGLYASGMYTWALRDGIVRVALESTTEPEADRIADAAITPSARIMTPTILGFGRLVFDATLIYRWRNYLNQTEFLGSPTVDQLRMRGYPTNFRVGADVMDYNLEFRTRPVNIFSFHLGGVAFYDVGDAFTGWSNFHPIQGAGFGVRGMLPQIDRLVYRFDVGFPLGEGRTLPGVTPVSVLFTLGQAFDPPTIGPSSVLPTQQ